MRLWPVINGLSRLNPRRAAWFAVGVAALALGAAGVFLPLLPTTPFVLVAAFAFGKSAPVVADWLRDSRIFGPVIADWQAQGAIAPRFKALAIVMMAAVFLLSVALSVSAFVLVVQAICITGAAAFILSRPNGPGE
ncbi:YbaN family protein [Pelagibius sp.]|uniref:YbaN family protein n=1 Tax=Pelagibius sp. TaxID=1931238 RepID=UPI003BB1EA3D